MVFFLLNTNIVMSVLKLRLLFQKKKDDATLENNFPTAQKSTEISDTAFV